MAIRINFNDDTMVNNYGTTFVLHCYDRKQ